MASRVERVVVACTTDHHQHKTSEIWPKIGWHVDHATIHIPASCSYVRHKLRPLSNNGKNKHRVHVKKLGREITEVTLEIAVEPRAIFGKTHWLTLELSVEMECAEGDEILSVEDEGDVTEEL